MAFTLSFDASTGAGLAGLNAFLQSRSYVIGFQPTQTDVALFNAIGKAPDAKAYPNVARFYGHINSFGADARGRWPEGVASSSTAVAGAGAGAGGKAKGKKAPVDDSDSSDDDMFADSDDDGASKKKKAKAAAAKAKAKAAASKKKEKAKKIEQTQCVYEVKPLEAGQDMAALETKIRAMTKDGLTWGQQFNVVDVAFGIQKLVVQAVIINDKVDTQDIEDMFESLEDDVQSADLLTMNRL